MVNYESALTDGTCPDAQPKQYVFYAPPSVVSAFKGAGVMLITEANNHGEDCGQPGLQTALATRTQTGYTILGIGQNAAQAFIPYTTTIHGEHIAIIAATQVIDSDLQSAWTATAAQPGRRRRTTSPTSSERGGGAQDRRHGDRQPALGHRARCVPPTRSRSRSPSCSCRPAPTSWWARTPTCCWGRVPRLGLRGPRPRELRLLRQFAARERQRLTGHHRHRQAHRPGDVATGRHRRRPAPATLGRRGHGRVGGLEPGSFLHQRLGGPGAPLATTTSETPPASPANRAVAVGRLGVGPAASRPVVARHEQGRREQLDRSHGAS